MTHGKTLVLTIPWAWLLLLIVPLAIVLVIALSEPVDSVPPYSFAHPSLDNLVTVATDPLYRDALLLSLKVAGISTLICLLVGYPRPYLLSHGLELPVRTMGATGKEPAAPRSCGRYPAVLYNKIRPHSSLGYRPPAPETIMPSWPLSSATLRLPPRLASEVAMN